MGELNPTWRAVRRWSGEPLLICKGEGRQGRGLAGPRGRARSRSLSLFCTPCPTRSRATGRCSQKRAWSREGGLPAQVSARFTGIITHEGMWAPSLQITGRPTLLPVFPLLQPSPLPRPSSCPRLVSLCTLLPLWETPTKSEIRQNPPSHPDSPTVGRGLGRPTPRQAQEIPVPCGLPTVTHSLLSLGPGSRW